MYDSHFPRKKCISPLPLLFPSIRSPSYRSPLGYSIIRDFSRACICSYLTQTSSGYHNLTISLKRFSQIPPQRCIESEYLERNQERNVVCASGSIGAVGGGWIKHAQRSCCCPPWRRLGRDLRLAVLHLHRKWRFNEASRNVWLVYVMICQGCERLGKLVTSSAAVFSTRTRQLL